jgi:predicted lipopolysaccharide heptosyltransferase III
MSEYLLLICSAVVSVLVNLASRRLPHKVPERILVVKLDHIGDVLLATPALRALRETHPEGEIDALVAPGSEAILAGNSTLNRVFLYDSPRFRRKSDAAGAAPAPRATLDSVARRRYTTVVELRGDWRTLALPFRVGAARRVDRGTARLRAWIERRARGAKARRPLHEVETNLEVVRPLLRGGPPVAPRVEMEVPSEAAASMRRKLEGAGVDLRSPIVCIHPGAAWRPRAWRSERFAKVAEWVRERCGARVVVLGSAEERDIEGALRAACSGMGITWLFGALTLPEVAALFDEARLLIGNDSGLAHVAAARGLPSIVLFGPQDPARFRPWSEKTIVLHHRVPCFPCPQTVCVRPENPCVNLIEVGEVEAKVLEIWGEKNAPQAPP